MHNFKSSLKLTRAHNTSVINIVVVVVATTIIDLCFLRVYTVHMLQFMVMVVVQILTLYKYTQIIAD